MAMQLLNSARCTRNCSGNDRLGLSSEPMKETVAPVWRMSYTRMDTTLNYLINTEMIRSLRFAKRLLGARDVYVGRAENGVSTCREKRRRSVVTGVKRLLVKKEDAEIICRFCIVS